MKIIANDGSVNFRKWQSKDFTYEIIATDGIERNITVWDVLDTVKRDDGKIHQFRRKELNSHFKNITTFKTKKHDKIKTTEEKKGQSPV